MISPLRDWAFIILNTEGRASAVPAAIVFLRKFLLFISSNNAFNYLSGHIGEAVAAALAFIRELFMINSHQVQ